MRFMPKFKAYKIPLILYSGAIFDSKHNITSAIKINPGVLAYDNLFYTVELDTDKVVNWEVPTITTYKNLVDTFLHLY